MGLDISELIRRVNAEEPGAQDALFTAADGELLKLVGSMLRNGGRNTVLDTTALVHESCLRIINGGLLHGDDRRDRDKRKAIAWRPAEALSGARRVRSRRPFPSDWR
jgi:hypothetical protein